MALTGHGAEDFGGGVRSIPPLGAAGHFVGVGRVCVTRRWSGRKAARGR